MKLNSLKILFYLIGGRRPWTLGYSEYKFFVIEKLCRSQGNKMQINYQMDTCFLDERVVEYPWIVSRLSSKPGVLLDAGSCLNYEFLIKNKKIINKKICVFDLAPDARCFRNLGVSYFFGDLRLLPFKDSSFDYITSISTLEHVGMNNNFLYIKDSFYNEERKKSYLQVVKNFYAILKTGGKAYLSFPTGLKRNLNWMQVFDYNDIKEIIKIFSPQSYKESYFVYKDKAWHPCEKEETFNSVYFDFHKQKPWNQSLPAAAGAVCLLELKK